MRIIAGKHRGRVLAQFSGKEIRPTPDRVKESLFQILTPRLAGARVLDLFAGSGALGLEALSRGAREVHFNDAARESLALAKKNAAALGEAGTFSALDFRIFLRRAEGKYDLIFCDPPYREAFLAEIASAVAERDLLAEGGLLLYESEREEETPAGWALSDLRRYGRTAVYFFTRDSL